MFVIRDPWPVENIPRLPNYPDGFGQVLPRAHYTIKNEVDALVEYTDQYNMKLNRRNTKGMIFSTLTNMKLSRNISC